MEMVSITRDRDKIFIFREKTYICNFSEKVGYNNVFRIPMLQHILVNKKILKGQKK